jgi:Respiratory-chain NADH dehydrogenase, 30 Kd subunit.
MEQQSIIEISPNDLLAETSKLKNEGYRLVAITCTSKPSTELSYSFDKEYEFISLRMQLKDDDKIESISSFYPYSFLYENEIKELFGVIINNISLDFNNHLYKISEQTPFKQKKEEV